MRYTQSHEWVELNGKIATVGITDHAQKELGEVVYVELPKLNHEVEMGDEIAVLESTKAAIDIYTPLSGRVKEVNQTLVENPGRVNQSAQQEGWLFKLEVEDASEYQDLMDDSAYREYIKQ